MKCPHCGASSGIKDKFKYCPYCGGNAHAEVSLEEFEELKKRVADLEEASQVSAKEVSQKVEEILQELLSRNHE